jgi:hypothetical protein
VLSLIYGVVHGCRGCAAVMTAHSGADSADRSRDSQLAPREERVSRHRRAAGGRELDIPAAHGELERAKSGRTSEPRPWNRLAARLFDYAIWGLVLALLLSELHNAGVVGDDVAFWLGHPLLRADADHGLWIPIESLLIASLQQTPGKWLFGVYLQFSISNAYARRDVRAQLQRALRRSFHVWWAGLACGFPVLDADHDRAGLRKSRAAGRDRLGLCRRLPGDAQPARNTEYDHRRRRCWRRCCGCTASPGMSR